MKNLLLIILLAIISSCSSDYTNKKLQFEFVKNISYNPDTSANIYGDFEQNKYTNKYFGLSLKVNQDWEILSKTDAENRYRQLKGELEKKDSRLKQKLENSRQNWHTLLRILHKNGFPEIHIMYEELNKIANVNDSKSYFKWSSNYIDNSGGNYPKYYNDSIYNTSIGGKPFLAHATIKEHQYWPDHKVICYSATYHDVLLNILVSYSYIDELNEIEKLLKSITWEEKTVYNNRN